MGGSFSCYAYKIVAELGKCLGDEKIVALAPANGGFNFETMYREDGLGFEGGKYRIPIMVKFDNLNDSGYMAYRFNLLCTKKDESINISVSGGAPFQVEKDEYQKLCEKIYQHLKAEFSYGAWFDENSPNYQSTNIGYT